jgi:sodium/bile acid cotransporter 7
LNTINKTDLIIVILLNAAFYITFSLLALYLARLPNILICQKETIYNDKHPLLLESDKKQKSWIKRWRFSREDTIAIMFCATMKTAAKGIPLINSTSDQGFISLFPIPIIVKNLSKNKNKYFSFICE